MEAHKVKVKEGFVLRNKKSSVCWQEKKGNKIEKTEEIRKCEAPDKRHRFKH